MESVGAVGAGAAGTPISLFFGADGFGFARANHGACVHVFERITEMRVVRN